MTGYQEILTDPSYNGQIVTLTYPLIGNDGINPEDMESYRPHAKGLVVGECSRIRSNWRSTMTLPEYLKENQIMGFNVAALMAVEDHYFVYPTKLREYQSRYYGAFLHGGISLEELILPVATLTPR